MNKKEQEFREKLRETELKHSTAANLSEKALQDTIDYFDDILAHPDRKLKRASQDDAWMYWKAYFGSSEGSS